MDISFKGKTYILKEEAKPYYLLLLDFIGNKVNYLFISIETYEFSNKEKFLNSFLENADKSHKIFDDMIDRILIIMSREKIKGILYDLIKRLKTASNFDWKNIEKFKGFEIVYRKILSELKELS